MNKQRVLIVHNYYQLPGGEDTVVANEKRLLEANGHKVTLYTRHNSELKNQNFLQKLLLPFSTIFNLRTYREVKRLVREEKIDVVHVHNTLNLISPSVYYAALACKVPVVQTIHNFRLLCPGATFYREETICEDCLTKGLGCAVKHGCYRDSKIQTLACVISMLVHRGTGVYGKIHYICLTEFNKGKLLELKQIREENIFIKPSFTEYVQMNSAAEGTAHRYIFAGRLEKLKGVDVLLEAWKLLGTEAPELLICGTGVLEDWCRAFVRDNGLSSVKLMGFVPNEETKSLVRDSRALILPTRCYEGFPMTILEAYAGGTPVITVDIGNSGDLVEENVTGFHFQCNNPEHLAEVVKKYERMDTAELRRNVRALYREKYTRETNYNMLRDIYNAVSAHR